MNKSRQQVLFGGLGCILQIIISVTNQSVVGIGSNTYGAESVDKRGTRGFAEIVSASAADNDCFQ